MLLLLDTFQCKSKIEVWFGKGAKQNMHAFKYTCMGGVVSRRTLGPPAQRHPSELLRVVRRKLQDHAVPLFHGQPYLSICLSVCLPACLPVCLSVCLWVVVDAP